MNRCMNKKVKIGDRNYTYENDEKENGYLTLNEQIDNKNIKIVIKGGTEKTIKDVEQLVIDVFGDQYIQRKLESLI